MRSGRIYDLRLHGNDYQPVKPEDREEFNHGANKNNPKNIRRIGALFLTFIILALTACTAASIPLTATVHLYNFR